MEEQVYLIKTLDEAQKLWDRLKQEHWESVIVGIHEDLFNLDVKKRALPIMKKYSVDDLELHWIEPDTAFLSGTSSFGGGISLNYYVKIEKLMFEYGMHALCLSYIEEADKTAGLVTVLGGLAKKATGQTYLQMLVKNHPMLRVDAQKFLVVLDAWTALRKVCGWTYEDKSIGHDLNIENLGMMNRCICLRFSWQS